MDIGAVRAVVIDTNFDVHGIDVIVQIGAADPVNARGLWLTPLNQDMPTGADSGKRLPNRVMALRRSEIPTMVRGARITAPETWGAPMKVWMVDGAERMEADHHRVHVVLDVEATADLDDVS